MSNHYIDALAELVGQENADKAVALADKARDLFAGQLRAAAEAVDPAPDQREALTNASEKVADLEAKITGLARSLADTTEKAASDIASRNAVIAAQNQTADTLRTEIATLKALANPERAIKATPPAT